MINFNEIKVSTKNPVFNNGEAGEVVVSLSVEKNNKVDNRPDWQLMFTDSDGRTLNEGFYYLNETKYATPEKFNNSLKWEAGRLKHIVDTLYGEVQYPNFNNPKEMLDWCMTSIAKKNGVKVKIGVTYGTVRRPNKNGYLGLKGTFPFMFGDLNENVVFGKNDLMQRPTPSAPKEEAEVKDLPWD